MIRVANSNPATHDNGTCYRQTVIELGQNQSVSHRDRQTGRGRQEAGQTGRRQDRQEVRWMSCETGTRDRQAESGKTDNTVRPASSVTASYRIRLNNISALSEKYSRTSTSQS